MQIYNSKEAVTQNLADAGCGPELIKSFLRYMKQERLGDQLSLLVKYRRCLLETVHEEQKRIDCLDYLIYQIRKQTKLNQKG